METPLRDFEQQDGFMSNHIISIAANSAARAGNRKRLAAQLAPLLDAPLSSAPPKESGLPRLYCSSEERPQPLSSVHCPIAWHPTLRNRVSVIISFFCAGRSHPNWPTRPLCHCWPCSDYVLVNIRLPKGLCLPICPAGYGVVLRSTTSLMT